MVLSRNTMFETTLLDLPPTDPMLSPWPPVQDRSETVTLLPLVTATQSSWLRTEEAVRRTLFEDDRSKPSELWAAGLPAEAAFGASPAELSRVMPEMVRSVHEVIEKQWTGQLRMLRFDTVERLVSLLSVKKWSGLATPPLLPCPSHQAPPLPSITWPGAPVIVTPEPVALMRSFVMELENVKVVVPEKTTVVPALSLVRSRVVSAGTVRELRERAVQEEMAALRAE